MEKVLELILKEDRTRDAWEYTDQIINKIRSLQDIRTDPEFAQKLILSRKLGKIDGYKNPQPHLTTYNKMVSRGEQPPGLGDRVQYYAIPGAMKDGISLCADSPDYVISTGGRIDNEWYIHHQVMPALERVFSVMNIDINTGKRIQVASDLFGFSQVEKSKEIIQPKKTKTGLFSFT
jgi:DNA polymerase elongation subunit (family B)